MRWESIGSMRRETSGNEREKAEKQEGWIKRSAGEQNGSHWIQTSLYLRAI